MNNSFKKTTSNNGLRIITVPSKETKAVAILVLVKTGSKYETRDINGISHFLEHMLFKGTKKNPTPFKVIEPLDKVGAEYNAFTGEEVTGYWTKIDAKHLNLALDWVSDIYLNALLKENDIERERGVILQELNMILDNPARYVHDLWTDLLYGDQPAGWRIIGREEVIKSIKRENFDKYIKEHYSSKNTIVAVAGNINPNVVGKVKKYFKSINTDSIKDKLPVKEKQEKPESLIYHKNTDQTHLCLGVRGYNLFHSDKYAFGLLGTILGGYMSSRLWMLIREKQGLAYYVSTGADSDTDTGFLMTRAGIDNRKVEKAINLIVREYRKIAQKGVTARELQKAKDCTKGRALLNMEASDEQASFYAFQELLTDKILTLEEKFAKIDAVTVDDIQRVAKDIFKPEKLNLALIGPFKDKNKFDKLLAL